MAQSKDFPDSFHRINIKGVYVQDGKLMLSLDEVIKTRPPRWELPGGGLDFGETFQDALKREVKEEMNLTVTEVADKPAYLWTMRNENARNMEWYYSLVMIFPLPGLNPNTRFSASFSFPMKH